MNRTFTPTVLHDWYGPTQLVQALLACVDTPITDARYTPVPTCAGAEPDHRSPPFELRIAGVSVDLWYDCADPDAEPIMSANFALIARDGATNALHRLSFATTNAPAATTLMRALVHEAETYNLIHTAHITHHNPTNNPWMRLFVFPHTMVLVHEYPSAIEAEELDRICAPNASAETRSGLATILLPRTRSQHQHLAVLAHRHALLADVESILVGMADGCTHFDTMAIAWPTA